jgi:hypothetical protein
MFGFGGNFPGIFGWSEFFRSWSEFFRSWSEFFRRRIFKRSNAG